SDFGRASRDLETAETLDPHDTDTHSIRCDLIEDRWGAEVALLAMQEIMAREAEYEYYHRRLARLQAQTRQIKEARQSYDRAVELLPADGPVRLERLEFELAQAPQTNPLADKREQ